MRKHAISTLFLVLALVTGACAGRQVRTRSIPAPPLAEVQATVPVSAPAEAPVADMAPAADPAPVQEAPSVTPVVTETPAMTGARMIAEHDAWVRAEAEKIHGTHVSDPVANNDEICAALRIDPERLKASYRESARRFAAFWRDMRELVAKYEAEERAERAARVAAAPPRPRPKSKAPKVEDDGREAVIGSLASVTPPVTEVPAAPAAPSILPPPRAATSGGPETGRAAYAAPQDISFFTPDAASVEESQAYWNRLLLMSLAAGLIGVLGGIFLAWRRERRLRAYAETPYDNLAEGTVLTQKVVNGRLVTLSVEAPAAPPPRSEPGEAERQAQMDDLEKTWNAAGEAMDDEDLDPTQPGVPKNRRFDLTDTGPDEEVPAPAPPALAETPVPPIPIPQPDADDAPRLASGSGRIINSSDEVRDASGFVDTPLPPLLEPRSEPESKERKVIVYEDNSSNDPPGTTTATTN